ncbi:vitellogenin-like [Macrobrachium nipponense]|uniref:vitellogenin-like n=1 Tax=Macrobrachium nipponense TaxID=159736 RepID=UPI0030C7AD06
MAYLLFFLLLALASKTATTSHDHEDLPKCSMECPISGSPKLSYEPGMTYSYAYSGLSEVLMTKVEHGVSAVGWHAQVKLTILGPCDIAISLLNPVWEGTVVEPHKASVLERHPLMVAVSDGRVQHVCSHPNDVTWSINLKKGIASAFQISLPSNSSINSGFEYIETDIVGTCPTKYEVKEEGKEKVILKKEKNHRNCEDNYPTTDKLAVTWLKTPLPLGKSGSHCQMDITKGIVTTIVCHDKNVIRPAYGIYKYIETHQQSKLELLHKSPEHPSSISNLRGERLSQRNLLFDHIVVEKDLSLVDQLDGIMKAICEKTMNGIEEDVGSLMSKALHLLRHVPDDDIERTLQKIRSGQYCSPHNKLESLFLDAVAFIHEPGAVKVMVNELTSGRATRIRTGLYTVAFFLTTQPNRPSVASLRPLFEISNPNLSSAVLGAAAMVGVYCHHNRHCYRDPAVQQLSETLSQKIQEKCSSTADKLITEEAIASLKALGNIGVITPEVADTVFKCLESEHVRNQVRINAAYSFRNVKCEHQVTNRLIHLAVDPEMDTEIRIASYLVAVRCMTKKDLLFVISKITPENNEQVRGFILSHLINLQKSTAPYKNKLRYYLSDIAVPNNFTLNIMKYSRNIDLSYFDAQFRVGLGLESNIVYTPGSFVPQSIGLSLTSSIGGTFVNLGEYGIRFEGLDSVLRILFGPGGLLMHRSSIRELIKNAIPYIEGQGLSMLDELREEFLRRRSFDPSNIPDFLKRIYKHVTHKLPKIDMYARLNDQEATYGSFSFDPNKIIAEMNVQRFFLCLKEALLNLANLNVDNAHLGHIFLQHHLPTIQGIPLKLMLEVTGAIGLKTKTNLENLVRIKSGNILHIHPTFSLQVDGFVGYDAYLAENGIKAKNLASSNSGVSLSLQEEGPAHFEFKVSLPEKIEFLNFKSETYFMKRVKGVEVRVLPRNMNDVRLRGDFCPRNGFFWGIKICNEYDLPDPSLHKGIPFGQPATFKSYIKRASGHQALRGYILDVHIQEDEFGERLNMTLKEDGSGLEGYLEGTTTYRIGDGILDLNYFWNYPRLREHYHGKFQAISREREKSVEISGHVTGNGRHTGRALRWELIDKSSGSKKYVELNFYHNLLHEFPPESCFLVAKLAQEDKPEEVLVNVSFATEVDFYDFLDFTYRVEFAMKKNPRMSFLPISLHKFEFQAFTPKWRIFSFVRPVSVSAMEYASFLEVFFRGKMIFAIDGRHLLQRNHHNVIDNQIKGIFSNTHYTLVWSLYNGPLKWGSLLKILETYPERLITHLEAMHSKLGESYHTLLLIKIPSYMRLIQFESVAVVHEPHSYTIETSLKLGDQLTLHCSGPITLLLTSKVSHIQANLSISSIFGGPYRVVTTIVFAEKKQALVLSLNSEAGPLFAIEWKIDAETFINYGFHLQLYKIINNKVNLTIGHHFVHLGFDNILRPDTHEAVRSKGFTDIDFSRKKAMGELSWDADKDPSRKIEAEITVVKINSSSECYRIFGGWTLIRSHYLFKAGIDLEPPSAGQSEKTTVQFSLTTPQKSFDFNTDFAVQQERNTIRLTTDTIFNSLETKEYRLSTETALTDLAGRFNYLLSSQLEIKLPDRDKTSAELEVKRQTVAGLGEVFVKMRMKSPSLKKPIEVTVALNKKQYSFNALWTIEIDTPIKSAYVEVFVTPEKVLRTFDFSLDLTSIRDLLKTLENVLNVHILPERVHVTSSSKRWLYHIRYDRNHQTGSHLKFQLPSRTLDANITTLPAGFIVRIIPDGSSSLAEYEFRVQTPNTWSFVDEELEIISQFKHPNMKREMSVDVQYKKRGARMEGKIIVDILPDSKDKITGTITSMQLLDNSINIEIIASGRILKTTPKITLTIARSPYAFSFDFFLHTAITKHPVIFLSGKLDQISNSNMAGTFSLASSGQKELEISGTIATEDRSTCGGVKMIVASHSRITGNHNIHAQLCLPGVLKVWLKNRDSGKTHEMTIGLPDLKTAEVRLQTGGPRKRESKPALLMQAMVTPSQIIVLDLRHDSKEISAIEKTWTAQLSLASQAMRSWLSAMHKEVISPDSETSEALAEASRLWHEVFHEASVIYNELDDHVILIIEGVRYLVFGNRLTYELAVKYNAFWNHLISVVHHGTATVSKMVSVFFNEFGDLEKFFIDAIRRYIHFYETGQVPEDFWHLVGRIQQSPFFRILKEGLEGMVSFRPEDLAACKQVISDGLLTLGKDFQNLRAYLSQLPEVQDATKWILRQLDFRRQIVQAFETIVYRSVQRSMIVALELEDGNIQILLPLRKPATSLIQAVSSISYNPLPILDSAPWSYVGYADTRALWTYIYYWPSRVVHGFPPYNRTAMLVGDHEILTFDGTVLRAPNSHCKVLLLAYGSTHLTAEHPHGLTHAKIALVASGINVVVNPDYTVIINGRSMGLGYEEKGDIKVWKKPLEVEVQTPMVQLQIRREVGYISVELNGWTFGHVGGLLGTYDGEAGNDWLMPNGRRATTYQQLVTSWQENQHCRSSAISPAHPFDFSPKHFVMCQVMLDLSTHCRGVIDPDPFVQMCYGTADPCDAMRAYREVCLRRGLQVPSVAYAC